MLPAGTPGTAPLSSYVYTELMIILVIIIVFEITEETKSTDGHWFMMAPFTTFFVLLSESVKTMSFQKKLFFAL